MNETMRVPVCYFEYFINEVLLPYYMKEMKFSRHVNFAIQKNGDIKVGSWVQIPSGTRIFFPSPPQINIMLLLFHLQYTDIKVTRTMSVANIT